MLGYKKISIAALSVIMVVMFAQSSVFAQDDLYYNPSTDAVAPVVVEEKYETSSNITRRYDDDETYQENDDYDYEYSSRIRRFHRASPNIDYYDPMFVDMYYYDPYYSPGTTIYVSNYNDYWSWRSWRRYQRWNRFNYWNNWGNSWGYSNWGYTPCAYSHWGNPWVSNNYYYDPYWTFNGYNPYYGGYYNNGWGNNWVNNNYYYSNNNGSGNGNGGYQPQTYTGIRRHGSSVNPGYARLSGNNGRLTPTDKAPIVEMKGRGNTRVVGDIEKAPTSKGETGRLNSGTPARRPADGNQVEKSPSGRGTESTSPRPNTTDARNSEPSRRTEETRPSRTEETRPTRRTEETRPTRTEETRPTRRTEETRPTRTEETRPTRRSEETRPSRTEETRSRPSQESRPSRQESTPSRQQEARPSRSNDSGGGSKDSGRSNSSGGGSGRSGGGGSRGGGRQ